MEATGATDPTAASRAETHTEPPPPGGRAQGSCAEIKRSQALAREPGGHGRRNPTRTSTASAQASHSAQEPCARPPASDPTVYEFIEARNSSFESVALIFSMRNSIESTGDSGASTLRRMNMRFRWLSSISNSSRRVELRVMSMAG